MASDGPRSPLVDAFCFVTGAVLVGAGRFIPPSSPDFRKRWLVAAVGILLLSAGVWLVKERFRRRLSTEANAVLDSLHLTIVFAVFSAIGLSGAFVFGDEIRGGAWFLPETVNNGLGRLCFGLFGFVALGFSLLGASMCVRAIGAWLRGSGGRRRAR